MSMQGLGAALINALEEYNGFIDVEAARADDRLSEREALSFYRDCAVSGFQFRLCLQFRDSGRLDKAAAVLRLSPGRYSTGKGSICSFMQSRFGQPKIIEDQDLPENAPLPELERRVWAGQYGESYTLMITFGASSERGDVRVGLVRKFPSEAYRSEAPSLEDLFY